MSDFVLFTDSSCDLPAALAQKLELQVLPLTVRIEDQEYHNYLDERELSFKDLYNAVRKHQKIKTSGVNTFDFRGAMEPFLQEGRDILYIGFSSGLSGTFNAGRMAMEELSQQYPERRLYAVDSLCASLGQGLLLLLCAQEKRSGKTIEEVRDFAENRKKHICHWFTVEDLMYLHAGGRLSANKALLGNILAIKPVMHMDDEGHLTPVDKARGRKASLRALAEKARQLGTELANQTVFISHGDCEEDALYLSDQMRKLGVKDVIINFVGPVIGAHTGPGVVSLFFVGAVR